MHTLEYRTYECRIYIIRVYKCTQWIIRLSENTRWIIRLSKCMYRIIRSTYSICKIMIFSESYIYISKKKNCHQVCHGASCTWKRSSSILTTPHAPLKAIFAWCTWCTPGNYVFISLPVGTSTGCIDYYIGICFSHLSDVFS